MTSRFPQNPDPHTRDPRSSGVMAEKHHTAGGKSSVSTSIGSNLDAKVKHSGILTQNETVVKGKVTSTIYPLQNTIVGTTVVPAEDDKLSGVQVNCSTCLPFMPSLNWKKKIEPHKISHVDEQISSVKTVTGSTAEVVEVDKAMNRIQVKPAKGTKLERKKKQSKEIERNAKPDKVKHDDDYIVASIPLCAANLPSIARNIQSQSLTSAQPLPAYPRAVDSFNGILCHIGVGGFHRSHQAFYTHQVDSVDSIFLCA